MEEKDHYTNEVIQQKREYVAMRRDMAIRSMVEVTPTDGTTRCFLLQMCMIGSILHALLSTNLMQPRRRTWQVRSLFDAAKENRPAAADPTAVEVRAAELRQRELELSSCPGRKGGNMSSSSASAGTVSRATQTLHATRCSLRPSIRHVLESLCFTHTHTHEAPAAAPPT